MVAMEKISTLISIFLKNTKKNFYLWLTVCLLQYLSLISIIRDKLHCSISGRYVLV